MMKRITLAISLALLCGLAGLFSLFSSAAHAEQAGMYYIAVSVTDLSSSGGNPYDSCANSSGKVIVPTRRQNGIYGQTWQANVPAESWDQNNITLWYYYNSYGQNHGGSQPVSYPGSQPVEGFPREIQLRGDSGYIKNNNNVRPSKLRFTLWVSGDNVSWTQVQSWEETTQHSGYWSSSKTVNSSLYPMAQSIGEISGADEISIPMPGGAGSEASFTVPVYDQYGVRWYQDNADVTWSLTGAPDGVSISETGLLTVTDAALQRENKQDFQISVQAAGADGTVKSKAVTVRWPQCSARYYDCDGTLLHGPFTLACNSAVNHPAVNPTRATDGDGRYTFERWGTGANGQESVSVITRDTDFTAVYTVTPHSWRYSYDRMERTCSECGFHQEGDDVLFRISVDPMTGGSVSVQDKGKADEDVRITFHPAQGYASGPLTASYVDEYGRAYSIPIPADQNDEYVDFIMPAYDIVISGNFRKGLDHPDIHSDDDHMNPTYTGTVQKPVIKDGDRTLTEGVDYTVSCYKDYSHYPVEPIDAGCYSFTCEGIGEYAGTYSDSFDIRPIFLCIDISGNSGEAVYDGTEHTVSGYTCDFTQSDPSEPGYHPETEVEYTGTAVLTGTNADEYTLELDSDDFRNNNSNFEVDFYMQEPVKLTIRPAEVNVTLTGNHKTVVYNGQIQKSEGYTFSCDHPLYTEADCEIDEGAFTVSGEIAGRYDMLDSDIDLICENLNSNFDVLFEIQPGYIEIEERPLIITAKDQTITYGEHMDRSCSSVYVEGLVENHILRSIVFDASETTIGTSEIEIVDAVIEDENGRRPGSYDISFCSGELFVEPAPLYIRGLRAVDRVYDGTDRIEIDFSEAVFEGLQPGETLVITDAQGHTEDENAGEDKTVVIDSDSISFDSSDDHLHYDFQGAECTVDIQRKPVIAAVAAENKIYDGLTDAAVTATVNGEDLVTRASGKDTLVLSGLYGTFENADAGIVNLMYGCFSKGTRFPALSGRWFTSGSSLKPVDNQSLS